MERQEQINRQLEELTKTERHQREMIEKQKMEREEQERTQRLKQIRAQTSQPEISELRKDGSRIIGSAFVVEKEPAVTTPKSSKLV